MLDVVKQKIEIKKPRRVTLCVGEVCELVIAYYKAKTHISDKLKVDYSLQGEMGIRDDVKKTIIRKKQKNIVKYPACRN